MTNKHRSEFVATRNSLTRQVAVLPQQDMEAFDAFIIDMVKCYTPETAVELQLAQSWATFQWRINRIAAIEDSMLTLGNMESIAENLNIEHAQAHNSASNAKTFRSEADQFAKISLYTQRLINQAEKVLKQLLHLQALRKERQEKELPEATCIYKLNKMLGEPFDPKAHGFIVTLEQVKTFVQRGVTLTQAAHAESVNHNREAYVKKYSQAAA